MDTIDMFGQNGRYRNGVNDEYTAYIHEDVGMDLYHGRAEMFEIAGCKKVEERHNDAYSYSAYSDGEGAIFMCYYHNTRELTYVIEDNNSYFSYSDMPRSAAVSVQITQIALEDFGMSYVIRLSDGRFIIIDGGRDMECEADKLYNCLKKGSVYEKPVIAAWIFTHPHSDHFHCFVAFADKYGDSVEIEKFLFNFPKADDLKHYPSLASMDKRIGDTSACTYIPRMLERIKRTGASVYTPHTGQIYRIGDAVCEILSCIDDTMHRTKDVNATSLVIRMELAGQVILWGADASFEFAQLPEKYGSYLKSDILQVPHHGFKCGDVNAEMRGYDLIKPDVCLLPASEYVTYNFFSAFIQSTGYLMRSVGVSEVIVGTPERTITLPYTAPACAKAELERKYLAGRDSCGSCIWVYSELSTDSLDDFMFTLLNMTSLPTTVWIDLFFEDPSHTVRYIKAELKPGTVRKLNIVGDEVNGDAMIFDRESLKVRGVPENASFAVRFMCDIPIVVSHKKHTASYHTSQNR